MKPILSDILDYSIENYIISVGNAPDGTTYIIPYDGAMFDEILKIVPYIDVSEATNDDGNVDDLYFALLCQYSHISPNHNLTAKYELSLENTVLATEYAPVLGKGRAKPNSLLRTARKCAGKIISQERAALQHGVLKTLKNNSLEHET